jgi:hypothetical protein
MLAVGAAPAIVKAANLMPVFMRRESGLIAPAEQLFVVTGVTGGNTLLTPAMVTREALRILHKKLEFTSRINGDYGFQVGDTISIKGVMTR